MRKEEELLRRALPIFAPVAGCNGSRIRFYSTLVAVVHDAVHLLPLLGSGANHFGDVFRLSSVQALLRIQQ